MLTEKIVYETLDKHPGSTAVELAKILGYSKSHVKNKLTLLKAEGEVYYERKVTFGKGHEVRWYP